MNKLYLDTSAGELSIAIVTDNNKPVFSSYKVINKIAEEIIPLLKEDAKKAGIDFSSFDEIYLTTGPGSYTGERISLTIGKTYAFIKPEVKIYLCSTLKLLASGISTIKSSDSIGLGLLDARNDAFFSGAYKLNDCVLEDSRREGSEVEEYIKDNPKAVICVMEPIKELVQNRFPNTEIVTVNLPELMVNQEILFDLTDEPLKIKPNYLRG